MGLFILQRIGPYAFGSRGPFKGIPIIEQSSQQMMDGRLKTSNLARNISPCDVESPVEDIKLNTTKKCMFIRIMAPATICIALVAMYVL